MSTRMRIVGLMLLVFAMLALAYGLFIPRDLDKAEALMPLGLDPFVDEYRGLETKLLVNDGIFTMSPSSSYPIFRYRSGDVDHTYFGYYTSVNTIELRYFDNNKNTLSDPAILWNEWGYTSAGDRLGDDHANPSIVVLSNQNGDLSIHNGKILVAAAEHLGRLQVRRSTKPLNIDAWDSPTEIVNDQATYARLIELHDGTIMLFARLSRIAPNSRAAFYYWKSHDAGETWSNKQLIVDAVDSTDDAIYAFFGVSPDHRNIHVAINRMVYGDPEPSVWRYRDIFYLRYSTIDDRWYTFAGGDWIELPARRTLADLSPVFQTSSQAGKEDWTYVSDIIETPTNDLKIISITDHNRGSNLRRSSDRDTLIRVHELGENGWNHEIVGESGRFHYVNMAVFLDIHGTRILGFPPTASEPNACIFERHDGVWVKGHCFSPNAGLGGLYARPFSTRQESDPGLIAIWNYINHYEGSPYTHWRSRVIGLFRR